MRLFLILAPWTFSNQEMSAGPGRAGKPRAFSGTSINPTLATDITWAGSRTKNIQETVELINPALHLGRVSTVAFQ